MMQWGQFDGRGGASEAEPDGSVPVSYGKQLPPQRLKRSLPNWQLNADRSAEFHLKIQFPDVCLKFLPSLI